MIPLFSLNLGEALAHIAPFLQLIPDGSDISEMVSQMVFHPIAETGLDSEARPYLSHAITTATDCLMLSGAGYQADGTGNGVLAAKFVVGTDNSPVWVATVLAMTDASDFIANRSSTARKFNTAGLAHFGEYLLVCDRYEGIFQIDGFSLAYEPDGSGGSLSTSQLVMRAGLSDVASINDRIYACDDRNVYQYSLVNGEWVQETIFTVPDNPGSATPGQAKIVRVESYVPYNILLIGMMQEPGPYTPPGEPTQDHTGGGYRVAMLNPATGELLTSAIVEDGQSPGVPPEGVYCGMTFTPIDYSEVDDYLQIYAHTKVEDPISNALVTIVTINGRTFAFRADIAYEGGDCGQIVLSRYDNISPNRIYSSYEILHSQGPPPVTYVASNTPKRFVQTCPDIAYVDAFVQPPNFNLEPAELVSVITIPATYEESASDVRTGVPAVLRPYPRQFEPPTSQLYDTLPDVNTYRLGWWERLRTVDTTIGMPAVANSNVPVDVALDRTGSIAVLAYQFGTIFYASVPGAPHLQKKFEVSDVGPFPFDEDLIRAIAVPSNANLFYGQTSSTSSTTDPATTTTVDPTASITCSLLPAFSSTASDALVGRPELFAVKHGPYVGAHSFDIPATAFIDPMFATHEYRLLFAHTMTYAWDPISDGVVGAAPAHELLIIQKDSTGTPKLTQTGFVGDIFGAAAEPYSGGTHPSSFMVKLDMAAGDYVTVEFNLTGDVARQQRFVSEYEIAAISVSSLPADSYYMVNEQELTVTDSNIGAAAPLLTHTPTVGSTENTLHLWSFVVQTARGNPIAPGNGDADFNHSFELILRVVDTTDSSVVTEMPIKFRLDAINRNPKLSCLMVYSTNDFIGNLNDGHVASYRFEVVGARHASFPYYTVKVQALGGILNLYGANYIRIDDNPDLPVELDIEFDRPTEGVCPVIALLGTKRAKSQKLRVEPPGFTGGVTKVLSQLAGSLDSYHPLFSVEAKNIRSQDFNTLAIAGNYSGDDVGGNFGLTYIQVPLSSPTTTTTTAATTTTTLAPDSWPHAWVYAACKDGVRGIRDSLVAFLPLVGEQALGICCTDGPAVYFTTNTGKVYYAPADLSSKVLAYEDAAETQMIDIAFDPVTKHLVIQADGPMPKIFKIGLNGDYIGTVANIGSQFTDAFGRMEVHPTGSLLYHAGRYGIEPVVREDPVYEVPGVNRFNRFPAIIDLDDTVDLDGQGSYFLERRPQLVEGIRCRALPRSFGFSGVPLLTASTSPAPYTTTTTTAAPTTTTTTTTTTSSGTTVEPPPTTDPPTTTVAGTTEAPPPPGDVQCWNSTSNVQAYPALGYISIPQKALSVEQITQVINDLPAGEEVVFSVRFTRVVSVTQIGILDTNSAILSVIEVAAAGTFRVQATVPADGTVIVLVRVNTGPAATTTDVDSASLRICDGDGFFPASSSLEPSPKWQGYLTTGVIDEEKLNAGLASCFGGENLPDLLVEPGRIFSASGLTRKRLEVWNENRTKFSGDPECMQFSSGLPYAYIPEYAGSPDNIRLSGGYQVDVTQDSVNLVTIRSIPGGGQLGSPPGELPLYASEEPPPGRTYLDGGLDCNEVLRTVNGVPGPHLEFRSDQGVLIEPHANLNRLVINVNGEGINFCPDSEEPQQVECLPADGPYCGPVDLQGTQCPGLPDNRAGFRVNPDVASYLTNLDGTDTDQITVFSATLPARYGTCEYVKRETGWSLNRDDSLVNCECRPPKTLGHANQIRTVSAVPIAAEEPLHVRNNYFTSGFTFWTHSGASYESVGLDALDHLPHVLVEDGFILQRMIPVPTGRYKLQALFLLDGDASYEVSDERSGTVVLSGNLDPARNDLETAFVELPETELLVKFTVSGSLRVTEIGLAKWL